MSARACLGRGLVATPTEPGRASAAGSCALPLDAAGDGDLDVALIDEEADGIPLLRNR